MRQPCLPLGHLHWPACQDRLFLRPTRLASPSIGSGKQKAAAKLFDKQAIALSVARMTSADCFSQPHLARVTYGRLPDLVSDSQSSEQNAPSGQERPS